MTPDNLKPMIKAAYLLQLGHGPFTPREFSEYLGVSDASQHVSSLLSPGYLAEHANSGEQRYSLTEKGRSDQSGSGGWGV